jgi:hypothetical protein
VTGFALTQGFLLSFPVPVLIRGRLIRQIGWSGEVFA